MIAFRDVFGLCWQGHVDKAIVVIKNKEDEPLERFVFALRTMIEVQGYDRDHRFRCTLRHTGRSELITWACSVENAITPALLGQYFRSFMSRLNMLEGQLGVIPTTGNQLCPSSPVLGSEYLR